MRRRTPAVFLGLAAVLCTGHAIAQETAPPDEEPPAPGPVFVCPPVAPPISIDGDLQEWNLGQPMEIGPSQVVLRAADYAGAPDASGRFYVQRSATTLFVAGEVLDERVVWNPEQSWRGDGVELFLDLRRDAARRPTDEPDADTYQLLLHPLASEVRWQFAWFRGRTGQLDDPVDGIEFAGMRFQDERGATVGYRFELALPLANFPGFQPRKGDSVGFDLAISDCDDERVYRQENYATWSGRAELARRPGRFGRLTFGDDPPELAQAPSWITGEFLPIAFVLVLLELVLAVWLARGLDARGSRLAASIRRLAGLRSRWKFTSAAVLLGLILAAGPVLSLVESWLDRRDLAARRELAALLRDVADEAGAAGLLRPQPPAHPSPLLSLVRGQTVRRTTDYDYTVLPPLVAGPDGAAVTETPARTLSGTPFLRRDVPATAARSGGFLVHPPVEVESATLIWSWQPDTGSDVPPRPGDVVAEIRFAHLDGTVEPPFGLVWGRHVDAWNDPGAVETAGHGGAPDSAIAFVTTAEGPTGETAASHADELRVPVAARDSPVVRVEVEQKAQGGRFTTHGITLHPTSGRDPLMLPLARATRGGVPTSATSFPAPDGGLLLHRGNPRATVACDIPADRLWLVVSLRKGFPDARHGLPVLSVRPEFDDGSADGPFVLENGADIDAELSPARQHGPGFRSELAFEWGLPDEARRHADLWSAAFVRPGRKLVRLHLEFRGEDEVVRVGSVVVGQPARSPRTERLRLLDARQEGYRLAPAHAARFDGIELTAFRDGGAYHSTLTGADLDRALARTVPPDVEAAIARSPDGRHETRTAEGRRIHTLSVPLPGVRRGTFVEMTWTGEASGSLGGAVFHVRTVLGALLAPLLVLVAADLILRLRSFHARLVSVCAAVSAVPAVLGFFAVPELVGGKIEAAEREAVLEKSLAVKAHLAGLPGEARKRAEASLRDEALQEAIRRRGLDDYRTSVAAALRDLERSLAAETVPGARVLLDVLPLTGPPSERDVFPPDVRFTVFRDRAIQWTSTLAYRSSRLTARGVAAQFDTRGDWQTTLVIDLPVDRPALTAAASAAGGPATVQLFTPRGFPVAGTAARVPADELPAEMERKCDLMRRILATQRPVVEARAIGGSVFTVAWDVLRGESDEVSLVATALPRTGADALLSRVGLTSLLVFGAGVAAQFLLLGLVAVATTGPLRRVMESTAPDRGTPAPPGAPAEGDEVAALDSAVAALRDERDRFRNEMSKLAGAVSALGTLQDPEAVVTSACEVLRNAAGCWGAVILATGIDGRVEVVGGFRGADRIAPMPIVIGGHSPLADVIRGRGEARIGTIGTVDDTLSRDERRIFEGATSFDAFPLGAEFPTGALVLLERSDGGTPRRRHHSEFLGALARQIGLALSSANLVRLAVRDRETGAMVASCFADRLREEVDRAVAARRPIALVLVSASSPPADPREVRAAAQRLAERLRTTAPQRAVLGRPEPLTFALAIPEADRTGAEGVAGEIRKAAADAGLAELRVRVGFAACPEDAGSSEFLLAEARRRLGDDPSDEPRAGTQPGAGDRLVAEARRLGAIFTGAEGRALLETIDRIAASHLTILLEGETGVGKEVLADLIHRKSPRRTRPLVKVNCAALPDALLESELFGYERGAFTGADRSKPGRFELADGGTLFLDEVGEMPLATQAKLLRVLEDHAVEHLGGTRPVPIDVRVVVATNRSLGRMVAEGRFREDLYYRLNGVTIAIPPLRARKEDLPALAEAFLSSAAESHGRLPPVLQPDAMDLLFRHTWPGNVRELRNLMEQAAVMCAGSAIRASDLLPTLGKSLRHVHADVPGAGPAPPETLVATTRAPSPSAAADAAAGGPVPTSRAAAAPASAIPASASAGAAPALPSSAGAPDFPPAREPADPADSPAAMSDRQRRLLALLAERTWITTAEYCDIVGISPRTGLRDVRELVERGVIVMEGKRRGARYRLP